MQRVLADRPRVAGLEGGLIPHVTVGRLTSLGLGEPLVENM